MRRRAHFQFHSANSVTITTEFRQRKFDLSTSKDVRGIDLIALKRVSEEQYDWDSGFVFDVIGREVMAKQGVGSSWRTIGYARARDFLFFMNGGDQTSDRMDALFEIEIK